MTQCNAWPLLACSALALSVLAACERTPEAAEAPVQGVESLGQIVPFEKHDAMQDYAAGMTRIADAVEAAHDEAAARTAAARIKQVNAELRDIVASFQGMSEDDLAATALASMRPLMDAQSRITADLAALEETDPAAARILRSELDLTPDF